MTTMAETKYLDYISFWKGSRWTSNIRNVWQNLWHS